MKLLALIILFIISFNSFAVSPQKDQPRLLSSSSKNTTGSRYSPPMLSPQYLSSYSFQNKEKIAPAIIFTKGALAFNKVTYTKVNWQDYSLNDTSPNSFIYENFSNARVPLNGINASYHTAKFIIEFDYVNDDNFLKKNEMVTLKSALTVWSFNAFNLAISGEISAGNRDVMNAVILNSPLVNNGNDYIINSSLSFSGSYLFNKSWAVIGSVSSHYLTSEFSKPVINNKSSDNVATIGTTYSF
jgi:hypothetical protein